MICRSKQEKEYKNKKEKSEFLLAPLFGTHKLSVDCMAGLTLGQVIYGVYK